MHTHTIIKSPTHHQINISKPSPPAPKTIPQSDFVSNASLPKLQYQTHRRLELPQPLRRRQRKRWVGAVGLGRRSTKWTNIIYINHAHRLSFNIIYTSNMFPTHNQYTHLQCRGHQASRAASPACQPPCGGCAAQTHACTAETRTCRLAASACGCSYINHFQNTH